MKKRVVSLALVFALLFAMTGIVRAEGEPVVSDSAASELYKSFGRKDTYRNFLAEHKDAVKPGETVKTDVTTASAEASQIEASTDGGREDTLLWKNEQGEISWNFEVKTAGLYSVYLEYMPLSETSSYVGFGITVNGKSQYNEATRIKLSKAYTAAGEIRSDSRGNDIRPQYKLEKIWMSAMLRDTDGKFNEPYLFYFDEGLNTISFVAQNGQMLLSALELRNYKKEISYDEYVKQYSEAKADKKYIEAETPVLVSDSTLYATYDRSSADTSPNDPVSLKLNTIGQSTFKTCGQFIEWELDVSQAGLYEIGIRFRQNIARGLSSYRRIYINGQVPFEEWNAVAFPFADNWQTVVLGDGSRVTPVYLEFGKNTLRMEVVPGSFGEIVSELEDVSYSLSQIYRRIVMITGTQPDPYRDYDLDKEITGLTDSLKAYSGRLRQSIDNMLKVSGSKGLADGSAVLNTLAVQLENFVDKPSTIPVRVQSFQSNISALSDFIFTLTQQPLEIDYFAVLICGVERDFEKSSGFFGGFIYGIQAFLGTFFNDYSFVGDVSKTGESITVWINLGRDQTQIIKEMSENMFTPESGISVNVKLVQQGLVTAILSGRAPDVSLFCASGDPVNIGARDGLTDLRQFEGFENLTGRFSKHALVPYEYNGKTYALPVQENFPVMFVRTDIFSELGLPVPKTWDEFYDVLSVLQKYNMTAGIPNIVSGNQMVTNNNIFYMLLNQHGGSLYNEKLNETALMTPEGIEAFKQWTAFYGQKGMPTEYMFYQRFRTGDMPIGIEGYAAYNMLAAAAPELKGLWNMYPIPGVKKPDGSVDNTTVGGGSCAVIMAEAKNPEGAFKFLDWFTDTGAQVQFGIQQEALLGVAGRYDTANLEALPQLGWSYSEAEFLRDEWTKMNTVPQVPGSYFVDRNLTNAFRKVVFSYKNPREMLLYYDNEINLEITRKRAEFGLE